VSFQHASLAPMVGVDDADDLRRQAMCQRPYRRCRQRVPATRCRGRRPR